MAIQTFYIQTGQAMAQPVSAEMDWDRAPENVRRAFRLVAQTLLPVPAGVASPPSARPDAPDDDGM